MSRVPATDSSLISIPTETWVTIVIASGGVVFRWAVKIPNPGSWAGIGVCPSR